MSKTVFITTGATVIFQELLDLVLTDTFLEAVSQLGYKELKLQFGVSELGESLFLTKFRNARKEASEWKVQWNRLQISGFRFTNDMNGMVSEADVVVSHAGTGSILDVLRLNKKLIVVINDKLMDNHQEEIATELENRGHLIKAVCTIDGLIQSLRKIDTITLKPLEKPKHGLLQTILHEL